MKTRWPPIDTPHDTPDASPLSVNVAVNPEPTVNSADAWSPGSVLVSDPVAVTVYDAGVLDVIVAVQLKSPAELPDAVTVHVALNAIDAPVPIVSAIVTDPPVSVVGAKPVPATVIVIPLGPELGVSVIVGVVTVNTYSATTVPEAASDIVTWGVLLDDTTIVMLAGMSPPLVEVNECVDAHADDPPDASRQ